VRARSTLANEPLDEKGLERRADGAHLAPPSTRRAATSSISSGVADKYQ
jgi:hypothetical protein